MKRILIGAALVSGTATVGTIVMLERGMLDFAADSPHSPVVYSAIEWLRERSVARGAAELKAPPDLSSPSRVQRGAGNYEAMCANCHLTPGGGDSEIRKGLYPMPPSLVVAGGARAEENLDAKRFWIIKHGIKGSGMPAWSKGGMTDEDIWDLVAFLRTLPSLNATAYRRLVDSSDGHSHGGSAQSARSHPKTGHAHDHGRQHAGPHPH